MRKARHRFAGRPLAALLCVACLLSMSLGAVSRAVAADEAWETWPRKTPEPAMEQKPPPSAAEPGAEDRSWVTWPVKPSSAPSVRIPPAGGNEKAKEPGKDSSYGKIAWIVLGVAAAIGIGIAVASGGGGDSGGGTVVNPGHQ